MHPIKWLVAALAESFEPGIWRARVHWFPVYTCKEPPGIVPLIAQRKPCRVLFGSVCPQSIKHHLRQLERPSAAGGLWRVRIKPVRGIVLRFSANRNNPAAKVNVLPLQAPENE